MANAVQPPATFQIVRRKYYETWPKVAFSFFASYEAIKDAMGKEDDGCVQELLMQANQTNKEGIENIVKQKVRMSQLQEISTQLHGNCAGLCTLIDSEVNKQDDIYFYYGQRKNHFVAWTQDLVLVDSSERTAHNLTAGPSSQGIYTPALPARQPPRPCALITQNGQPRKLQPIDRLTKYEVLLRSVLVVSRSETWILNFRTVVNGKLGFDGRITWNLKGPTVILSDPRVVEGRKGHVQQVFRFKEKPDPSKTKPAQTCRAMILQFSLTQGRKEQWELAKLPFLKIWKQLVKKYGNPEYEDIGWKEFDG